MSIYGAYPGDEGFAVVGTGIWLYGGSVPTQINLLARPVADASSRYVVDEETGDFVIDERTPIPETADGYVYYVGGTQGGEFLSIEDAIAWADRQAWGPVKWALSGRGD
jgi:hypothetical protein